MSLTKMSMNEELLAALFQTNLSNNESIKKNNG